MDERRAGIRRQCDDLGLAGAKAELTLITDETNRRHFIEWINDQERKEAAERDAELRRWNEQALAAARLSAETSREAAVASKRSAFWTMWAAIAAAVSAAIPLLQAVNVLPK